MIFRSMILWASLILLPFQLSLAQEGRRNENYYSSQLARRVGGKTEVRLFDGSRIDVLGPKYAWEVEWAPKWKEAIGQSLYYSAVSERPPAILLLVRETKTDTVYILRCLVVCHKYNIHLEILKVPED